jgi:hypothetical protein
MAACAQAWAANPNNPPTDQSSRLGQICKTVIRVRRGEAHYAACVSSLSQSLRSVSHYGDVRQGLAAWNDGDVEEPRSSTSYFYASPHEVSRRVQFSCARSGFDPADGAFANCVANLASALDAADNIPAS